MSNIRKNINNIFDLRINRKNYWDLQLSQDNIQCYTCDSIISGDVVSQMIFDITQKICSNILWDGAVSFNQDLCDIGLTGVDNRFVDNFSGETYNPSGDTTFCLTRVSGDNFCYEMNVITGDTPDYVQFCGGFFQGFYKLEGYDYQVLPNNYNEGWTKEFWLKKEECPSGSIVTITGTTVIENEGFDVVQMWESDIVSGGTCIDKFTLNDLYPNNKDIFYYWGLRAENKFCIFSQISGLTTCTGIPLAPDYIVEEFKPDNGFLYYNRKSLCEPTPPPTVELTDCCDGILNNALAFKINEDNSLGLRLLTTSGECVETEDGLRFSGTPIIEEYFTDSNIISNDIFHYVVYRFEPYVKDECINSDGVLSVFVDGLLKLKIENFINFQPYPLNEDKDKQLGVPYNISVGGGTQGLLESIPNLNVSGIDMEEYEVCDYTTFMRRGCVFAGLSINGQEIESPPLNFDDYELIEVWLEMNLPRRQGDVSVTLDYFKSKDTLKIQLNGVLDSLDYIKLSNGRLNFCIEDCYIIPAHNGVCGVLEENFAGSFIGGVSEVRIHDRALCFSEIQCNWNIEKSRYNRKDIINNCI